MRLKRLELQVLEILSRRSTPCPFYPDTCERLLARGFAERVKYSGANLRYSYRITPAGRQAIEEIWHSAAQVSGSA